MTHVSEIGGDVVAGGSALAGFVLVYLGGITTAFSTYDSEQQDSVKAMFRRRAWFAVVGIVLSLTSVGLRLMGKRLENGHLVDIGIFVLLVTLAWPVATAVTASLAAVPPADAVGRWAG